MAQDNALAGVVPGGRARGRPLPDAVLDKEWNRAVVRAIASRLDPENCDAFLYAAVDPMYHPWKYSIDAMWAALDSGLPSVNGYTGFSPAGWALSNCTVRSLGDEEQLRRDLAAWVQQEALVPERTCYVQFHSPAEPPH